MGNPQYAESMSVNLELSRFRICSVAPRAGAWIEIKMMVQSCYVKLVSHHGGATNFTKLYVAGYSVKG